MTHFRVAIDRMPRVVRAIAVLIAAVLLTSAGPGESGVDRANDEAAAEKVTLSDSVRGKSVSLLIYRPVSYHPANSRPAVFATTSPVILFSHPAGRSPVYAEALFRSWAARGFLVIAPTHADVRFAPTVPAPASGTRPTAQGQWIDRVRDLSFVLDQLPRILELTGSGLPAIAVAGEGLGAQTTLLMAGARPDWPGAPGSVCDPRVSAVIVINAPPSLGLSERSFKSLAMPTLVITSAATPANPPTTRQRDLGQQPYLRSPDGDKFLLSFQGAAPPSLAGDYGANRQWQKYSRATREVTATFLDAYLNGNTAAKDLLIAGSVIAPFSPFTEIEGK